MHMIQYQIDPIKRVVLQIQEVELYDDDDPIIESLTHREGHIIKRSRDHYWYSGDCVDGCRYHELRTEWLKDHLTVWSRWTVNYKEVQALRKWYRSLNMMQQLGML